MAVLTNKQFYIIGGAVALGALVLYSKRNAFNPMSDENVVYASANALFSDPNSSIGSDIYDTWNPDFNNDGVPDAGPGDVISGMFESVRRWFI